MGTPWGTGMNWLGVRRSCLGTTLAFPLVGPHRPRRLCLEAFSIDPPSEMFQAHTESVYAAIRGRQQLMVTKLGKEHLGLGVET